MNGLEFLSQLKSRKLDIPVVLITGYGDESVVAEAFKSGIADYLSKERPNYLDILPPMLEKVVREHREHTARISAETELQEYHQHLEEMVETRTRELNAKNRELAQEVKRRKKAETELRKHQQSLEKLVEKRTAKLQQANRKLQQEIEQRKAAQEEIRSSEKKFRELFNNMGDGVVVYARSEDDKDFVIKNMNRAGRKISNVKILKSVIDRKANRSLSRNPGIRTVRCFRKGLENR